MKSIWRFWLLQNDLMFRLTRATIKEMIIIYDYHKIKCKSIRHIISSVWRCIPSLYLIASRKSGSKYQFETHFSIRAWTPLIAFATFQIKLQWTVSTSHLYFIRGISQEIPKVRFSRIFFFSRQTFNSLHITANKERVNKNTFVLACDADNRETRYIFNKMYALVAVKQHSYDLVNVNYDKCEFSCWNSSNTKISNILFKQSCVPWVVARWHRSGTVVASRLD